MVQKNWVQAVDGYQLRRRGRQRRRAAERDLTRREVQSALKHGGMHTTHFGKRVVTADGVTVILDQQSPVVITTWKTSYPRHGQQVVKLTEIKEESSES